MSDESWWSRRSSKFRNMSARKLGSAQRLGAPWVLDTDENKQSNTAHYDRHHTRKRLFFNCTFQLFVTGAFCAGLVGTLKGFQDRGPLDDRSKRVFNAIVTGLSIAIGINLASSLQSYARMLRWRLLATGWKSLEEFDLILGAESQTKVLRLLWTGRRRKAGFPYLSKTQICCIIWLLVNLAAQVLVAMNGLTYSVDFSNTFVKTRDGYISVANFTNIMHVDDNGAVTLQSQQNAAQAFGIEGEDYATGSAAGGQESETDPETIYQDNSTDTWVVRFFNFNADNLNVGTPSDQYIETNASCIQYSIVGNPSGNSTQITYTSHNSTGNITENIGGSSPGSTTFALKDYTSCGGRCATLLVYQAADDFDIVDPAFFICKSVVSVVQGASPSDGYVIPLADLQAAIFAGSIASSGSTDGPVQFQIYDSDSAYASGLPDSADDVKVAVSAFSADAIAAFAVNGPRQEVYGQQPTNALQLNVEWKFFIPLISVIPLLQALAYIIVIAWANKAIIRDDSYLAISQLYRPVLDKLGSGGCILTGEEIIKRDVFKDDRVVYGFTDPDPTSHDAERVRHIGIIFENDGSDHRPTIERAWPNGLYNGPDERLVRRRQRRMSF